MASAREHWEKVYAERRPDELSWYQESPEQSLAMIRRASVPKQAPIIDVGGGASRLVDSLLAEGYQDLSVLDISAKALAYAQERLGPASSNVRWIEADATSFEPARAFELWHDRAVFHFLTEPAARSGYLAALHKGLRPGGSLVIAAFAPEGPEKCSGLPVRRYSAESMQSELGPGFELAEQVSETHRTPWDTLQNFNFFRFKKLS